MRILCKPNTAIVITEVCPTVHHAGVIMLLYEALDRGDALSSQFVSGLGRGSEAGGAGVSVAHCEPALLGCLRVLQSVRVGRGRVECRWAPIRVGGAGAVWLLRGRVELLLLSGRRGIGVRGRYGAGIGR